MKVNLIKIIEKLSFEYRTTSGIELCISVRLLFDELQKLGVKCDIRKLQSHISLVQNAKLRGGIVNQKLPLCRLCNDPIVNPRYQKLGLCPNCEN